MSKKLASFADVILLDVKYGDGAFMRTAKEAERLARLMVKIGARAGRKVSRRRHEYGRAARRCDRVQRGGARGGRDPRRQEERAFGALPVSSGGKAARAGVFAARKRGACARGGGDRLGRGAEKNLRRSSRRRAGDARAVYDALAPAPRPRGRPCSARRRTACCAWRRGNSARRACCSAAGGSMRRTRSTHTVGNRADAAGTATPCARGRRSRACTAAARRRRRSEGRARRFRICGSTDPKNLSMTI